MDDEIIDYEEKQGDEDLVLISTTEGEGTMPDSRTSSWNEVFKGLNMFTDDYMENGRGNLNYEKREWL